MSPDEHLLYESRVRTRQMIVAMAAGALLMIATIVGLAGPHAKVDELTLGLITDHKRGVLNLIAAVVSALADIGIAWTLLYLFRCAKARSPTAQMFIPILAVIGAALATVAGILNAIVVSIKVHDFVTTGMQTYDEADRLTSGSGLLVLQVAAQVASLLLAVSFVLVSLQAMRVGLLPRFLGYLGMIAGALILFPIIVVPVVQLYWLVAVGYLVSGRWPSGLPAAWRSGRAEAWPSQAEVRARRAAAAEVTRDRRQRRKGGVTPAGDSATTAGDPLTTTTDPETDFDGRTRAATPKRKRKRRH